MTTALALPLMYGAYKVGKGAFTGKPDFTGTPNEYSMYRDESYLNRPYQELGPPSSTPASQAYRKQMEERDAAIMNAGLPKASTPIKPEELSPYSFGGIPQPNKPPVAAIQPPALPQVPQYDPRYENASRENYAAQMANIRGALAPINEHHNSLINQLNAYGAQGGYKGSGGGIAAATALGLMQNDYDTQAGMAKEEARLAGGLAPINLQAMHWGMEPRVKAQQSIFEEKLPSKLATNKYHEAQAEHAKAQASALPTHTLTEAIKAKAAAQKESAHPYVGEMIKMLPNITNPTEYNAMAAQIAKMTNGQVMMPKREESK